MEQWEDNSQAYANLIDGRGTPHHRMILNPCVERLIGEVKGKQFLDAGCGEGYLSRSYAQKGARVTGIDISPRLISIAQSQEQTQVHYKVENICKMNSISNDSFDIVLCNLVLLNVPCFDEALSEFYRVLKPEGILVFSIVHPAFNFYGPGKWEMGEKDPQTQRRAGLFFRVDNYYDETVYQRYWRTRKGEKFPRPISFFHRTVSTYVNTVCRAGFAIVEIDEPRPEADDDFFERENRIPFFLVVKARKTE